MRCQDTKHYTYLRPQLNNNTIFNTSQAVQYRDLVLSFTLINKPHVQRDRIVIVPFVAEFNLYSI
jgi:hypothetical protein